MSAKDVIAKYLNEQFGSVDSSWECDLSDDADAILSALDAAGYAVVPKNPTADMRDAADKCEPYATYYASAERIWEAMLTAAKEAP